MRPYALMSQLFITLLATAIHIKQLLKHNGFQPKQTRTAGDQRSQTAAETGDTT